MHNKNIFKFLIFVIALILLCYLGRLVHIDEKAIQNSLAKFSLLYSALSFIILYVVVTFFVWFSKDIFKFLGAVLFGAYFSTLFIWIAESINAFILFYLARFLGRGFVESFLKTNLKNLDERLARINFFWLFLFRMAPLIPFRFLDLAAGLTKISFRRYFLVVIFGSPLRIFWVQFILAGVGKSVLNNPYALTEYIMQNKPLFFFSLVYLVLVVLVALKIKHK